MGLRAAQVESLAGVVCPFVHGRLQCILLVCGASAGLASMPRVVTSANGRVGSRPIR